MPGYAYPVGATSSEEGILKGINYVVSQTSNPTSFYTATYKTKVLSVLSTNKYGTILPVKLYVFRASDSSQHLITESRVLKQKYMVQQLVSGDLRVEDENDQQVDRHRIATEFILNPGDSLRATCPIASQVSLTLTLKEKIK